MKSITDAKIHTQVFLPRNVHAAFRTASALLNIPMQKLLGEVLVYGLCYLNEKRGLNLDKWDDRYRFPTFKDIEENKDQFLSLDESRT